MTKDFECLLQAVERIESKVKSIEDNVHGMTKIRNKAQTDLRILTERRLGELQLPSNYRNKAYGDLRREFGTSSYRDILERDYGRAVSFLKQWVPRM